MKSVCELRACQGINWAFGWRQNVNYNALICLSSVSLEDFRGIVELAKQLGLYD